jgi:hypothetical protein
MGSMAIYKTFSQRQTEAAKAGQPEVYVYDKLPEKLINQIVMIWNDVWSQAYSAMIGGSSLNEDEFWGAVRTTFAREHGIRQWPGKFEEFLSLHDYFADEANHDQRLDLIEMVFRLISRSDLEKRDSAIDELNQRFRMVGVGYQFEGHQLLRMDSTVAHGEIVKPALVLLGGKGFEEADRQYRDAHAHYRRGEYPQAVTEAGKAFESALKAICASKGWEYEKGARATDLVKIAVKNGLFPEWLESGLTAYVAMMKTGLPTVRNELGPHGTAPKAEPVRAYLARYALNMSASNMLLVAEAASKKR